MWSIPMTVPTPSMEPTILVGDRLLIDKFTIRNGFKTGLPFTPRHAPERGDVVVFQIPKGTRGPLRQACHRPAS